MPAKTHELQLLNVENLGLKTNLYGNLLIPPSNGKESERPLQKAKSLDKVHLSEIKSNDGHHNSMISIESTDNRNGHLRKLGLDQQKVINRYDSGYGSYVDFRNETTFSESNGTLIEEHDHLNDIYITGNDVSLVFHY